MRILVSLVFYFDINVENAQNKEIRQDTKTKLILYAIYPVVQAISKTLESAIVT